MAMVFIGCERRRIFGRRFSSSEKLIGEQRRPEIHLPSKGMVYKIVKSNLPSAWAAFFTIDFILWPTPACEQIPRLD